MHSNKYCSQKSNKLSIFAVLLLSFLRIVVNAEMKIVANEFEGEFNDSEIKGWIVTSPF